jgi:hypothetical protein
MPIGAAVAGAATSFGLNALFGPDGGTAPSYGPVKVEGAEFQPFTYTGTGGFGVTGTPEGSYGYDWSAQIPDWLKGLGELGGGTAGGLFQDYVTAAQQDPYAAADEFYQRGLTQLRPELAKQQIAAQERMFGTGRLGQMISGQAIGAPTGTGMVNPDAYGLAAGQASMLQDLYTKSLSAGQQMQTQRLNQLSSAAAKMLELGMKPNEIEQALIKFGANLEGARAAAMKAGTSMVPLAETTESVLAANLANTIGQGVQDYFTPKNAVPKSYTGSWQNPDNYYSSGPSLFGIPDVQNVNSTNAFAVGGGNPFWN